MASKKIRPETFPDDCAEIIAGAISRYKGNGNNLESAIGMLFMGHTFGWKVLYILHSVATVKKYEDILGIKAKNRFPEFTQHSNRSMGYRVAKDLSNFWRVVRGLDFADGAKDKEIKET